MFAGSLQPTDAQDDNLNYIPTSCSHDKFLFLVTVLGVALLYIYIYIYICGDNLFNFTTLYNDINYFSTLNYDIF